MIHFLPYHVLCCLVLNCVKCDVSCCCVSSAVSSIYSYVLSPVFSVMWSTWMTPGDGLGAGALVTLVRCLKECTHCVMWRECLDIG